MLIKYVLDNAIQRSINDDMKISFVLRSRSTSKILAFVLAYDSKKAIEIREDINPDAHADEDASRMACKKLMFRELTGGLAGNLGTSVYGDSLGTRFVY